MGGNEFFILAGALVGGYVSGLMGFGTGLAALTIWLHVIQPIIAAPLVLICSIIAQIQTLPAIWHAIVWRQTLPFILGGLIGVPIGTKLLGVISLQEFKLVIGSLLILSCSFILLRRSPIIVSWGGRIADSVIGFTGGILGGLSGLSGSLPMIWVSLRGWGKDEKRGVIQTFNLSILLFATSSQALGGYITMEVGRLTLIAFPGIILGAWMGRKTYDRMGDGRFNQVVLVLLLLAGVLTIVSSI